MKDLRFVVDSKAVAFVDSKLSFKDSKIKYSNLLSLEGSFKNSSIGIKYVTQGSERYVVDKKVHTVNKNQFLVLNSDREFECSFRNGYSVLGACISLSKELVSDAHNYLLRTEEDLLNYPFNTGQLQPEFHEAVYSEGDKFSTFIRQILKVERSGDITVSAELYQTIAIQLLMSQKVVLNQINKIRASKTSTRKELYDRIYLSKLIMESTPAEKINIPSLASECALSEFHFYRSFKAVFGISPYQYLLTKRLENALQILKKGADDFSITDVAYLSGFPDIYSFSRSFKKYFKISPTECKANSRYTFQ